MFITAGSRTISSYSIQVLRTKNFHVRIQHNKHNLKCVQTASHKALSSRHKVILACTNMGLDEEVFQQDGATSQI